MKKRKPGLAAFAQRHDVIVFVSGKNSSNGKMLFEYCRSLNRRSHWISGPGEIEGKWFRGAGSIGISGATSTSKEQLESVSNHVNKILSS
jgi:4-hydroxy-3-methylbut-2-enyl diphosphate reductase